jgi:hypothetical protein
MKLKINGCSPPEESKQEANFELKFNSSGIICLYINGYVVLTFSENKEVKLIGYVGESCGFPLQNGKLIIKD